MSLWKRIERIGYLRAASLMDREGYPNLAVRMREEAAAIKND